jgi:hypothetical protein
MATAPPVPHHFVITVTAIHTPDKTTASISREGVVMWRHGETRQDQFCKVTQFVNQDLRADGYTAGFVTTFWSLHPNKI